jgi:hypothetical protein
MQDTEAVLVRAAGMRDQYPAGLWGSAAKMRDL